jgi:hypothetical protein
MYPKVVGRIESDYRLDKLTALATRKRGKPGCASPGIVTESIPLTSAKRALMRPEMIAGFGGRHGGLTID